jgi:hypothetical protein
VRWCIRFTVYSRRSFAGNKERGPERSASGGLLRRAFTKIDAQEDEIFYELQHGVYHID